MKCTLLKPTQEHLRDCARQLSEGEVIGVPTETVYGLAGNALSESSARKIFSIKGRPLIDPLIVHCAHPAAALEHIEAPLNFEPLATAFWPGPMTRIVKKKPSIPAIVTAGLDSVAVRVPHHVIFRSLLEQLDFPLAAPSANPFGYVSPTCAEHVRNTLGHKVATVLDGGPCQHGLESTILDIRDSAKPTILRHGPIHIEAIEDCLGQAVIDGAHQANKTGAQTAPGLLAKHYSPTAQVHLFGASATPSAQRSRQTAIIFQSKPDLVDGDDSIYWLSEAGDARECARNLYALLQRLDTSGFAELWVQLSSDPVLGRAINDRLQRAAAK